MKAIFEAPPRAEQLLLESETLLSEIFQVVNLPKKSVLLSARSRLLEESLHRGKVYRLTEGVVSLRCGAEVLLVASVGDVIGLEELLPTKDEHWSSTFAVRADEYDVKELLLEIVSTGHAQTWTRYLLTTMSAYVQIIAAFSRGERDTSPDFRLYPVGTVILQQGTSSEEVLTLIQGRAEVKVDGVVVGEVLTDEIFGALGALTRMPRMASVIAVEECSALCLKREQFIELINRRPETVLKLVEDMARTITSLNEKIVGLGSTAIVCE